MGRMLVIVLGVSAAAVLLGIGLAGHFYGVGPGVVEYNTYVTLGVICLGISFILLGWKEELVPLVVATGAFERSWIFWVFLGLLIVMVVGRFVDAKKGSAKGSLELPTKSSGRV